MSQAQLTDVLCYYEEHGRGEPIVLIPGLGCSCRIWDPVVTPLSEQFCTLAVDMRGVGRSTPYRTPHRVRDYAADIIELLDHLQIERAHVAGISLGGIIAQRLAVDHPSRVNRLTLISCAHRFGPYLREMALLVGHTLRRFPKELFERTMDILGSSPLYLDENPHVIGVDPNPDQPVSRKVLVEQLRCLMSSELHHEEYHIQAPTLVLAGEYDVLIPNCYQRQMASEIPDSRFVLMRGAGHNPLLECPQCVLPILRRFFKDGVVDETGVASCLTG